MIGLPELALLVLVGILGGVIGGIGGPGGIPVVITLNVALALSSTVAAATASSIFVLATITATGLYLYSDGIEWLLAATVGVPAVVGTHVGTRVAVGLPLAAFEQILGGTLLLAAVGIVYQQQRKHRTGSDPSSEWQTKPKVVLVATGSLLIGVTAGITGIGGPALIIPFLLVLGIEPITAIGAGLASAILITTNSALGHVLLGSPPALVPAVVIGVPFVLSQVIGWKYVHSVSERTVAYSIAALAVGSVVVIVL